ncbi:hypothetical protein RJ639_018001 [Escallonia herrerae]|uniref:Tetratricopeptide repeat protein n=1 Tax=Escallonia herrerae TaxID=1293975 RepID=A0AA88V6F1_9ASTE|nr:hypothetical protein RJ639_018001 [Escallonia herrerae]
MYMPVSIVSELVEHLQLSEISLRKAKENAYFCEEGWSKKLRSLVPVNGITVSHIRTGKLLAVSRMVVAVFLLITMEDFSDRYFRYQDVLFNKSDGRLELSGNNYAALWPGDGKPGLWMNSISRMGAIYTNEAIELVIPPVFYDCTRILDAGEQIVSRDLYWGAIYDECKVGPEMERAEEMLVRCVERNPFVGEPYLVLGQLYLSQGRFEEAERDGSVGVGECIGRVSWEGRVAWAMVLLMKAKARSWPQTSWAIINPGLVK